MYIFVEQRSVALLSAVVVVVVVAGAVDAVHRRGHNVHAIIRRSKNEGTVGGWMRWTFPPFASPLSSPTLFLSSSSSSSSLLPSSSSSPSSAAVSAAPLPSLIHVAPRRNVGSRVAPRATALLYVEQPPPRNLSRVPASRYSLFFPPPRSSPKARTPLRQTSSTSAQS